jgi:hypothetical protein
MSAIKLEAACNVCWLVLGFSEQHTILLPHHIFKNASVWNRYLQKYISGGIYTIKKQTYLLFFGLCSPRANIRNFMWICAGSAALIVTPFKHINYLIFFLRPPPRRPQQQKCGDIS